jgi:hypothetical protein
MHTDIYRELNIRGDQKMHQAVFDIWRDEFNIERPHEALRFQTTAEFKEILLIKFPSKIL